MLLFCNYILYFELSNTTLAVVFIISIIIMISLYNFSIDKILSCFLFFFVLFPKKPISSEWTNKFLNDLILEANFNEGLSFFEFYILPMFSFVLFIKAFRSYNKPSKEIYFGYSLVLLFILGYVFSTLINSINGSSLSLTRIIFTLIYSSQILIIPPLLIYKKILVKKVSFFENLILFLIILLSIEALLIALGLLPDSILRQSVDWREGFRSIFFGYSVFVGFFALLGFCISIIRFIKSGNYLFLVFASSALIIQFLTFDRTPLLASFIFLLLTFYFKYKMKAVIATTFVFPLIFFSASFIIDSIENTDISKHKSGGFFSTESSYGRLGMQLRYIDAMIDNSFAPAGLKTYKTFFNREIKKNFLFNNPDINWAYNDVSSKGITQAHNIFIQMAFDLGFASFIMYLLIIFKYFIPKYKRNDKYYYALGIAVVIFYLNQASPTYYFSIIMVFIFSLKYTELDTNKDQLSINIKKNKKHT